MTTINALNSSPIISLTFYRIYYDRSFVTCILLHCACDSHKMNKKIFTKQKHANKMLKC